MNKREMRTARRKLMRKNPGLDLRKSGLHRHGARAARFKAWRAQWELWLQDSLRYPDPGPCPVNRPRSYHTSEVIAAHRALNRAIDLLQRA
jgi:hypothetical protein